MSSHEAQGILRAAGVTEQDLRFFRARGLASLEIADQISRLSRSAPRLEVDAPATVGHGISILTAAQQQQYARAWRRQGPSCLKFVPASGAATRMFAELSAERERLDDRAAGEVDDEDSPSLETFDAARRLLAARDRWPFDLSPEVLDEGGLHSVLEHVVGEGGLQLHRQPKGLLPFHRHGDRVCSAFEEQLWEGLGYLHPVDGTLRFHFTVSPEHEASFRRFAESLTPELETRARCGLEIGFSTQDPRTDTVALDDDGELVRTEDGTPLLRPGGHGALLRNLQAAATAGLQCMFVKNIDNVLPQDRAGEVVLWKEILGGRLLELRESTFRHLRALRSASERTPEVRRAAVEAARDFWNRSFGNERPGERSSERSISLEGWIDRLDRPLRVCGMVRNEGAPGGGPFWISGRLPTLQIVESAELQTDQRDLLASGTHFNPVDLALSVTNEKGELYALSDFVDPERVFVARKTHRGRSLRALEHPGLWNGAMARWNTQFVEVPASTFAPVKTIFDLLKPAHQP